MSILLYLITTPILQWLWPNLQIEHPPLPSIHYEILNIYPHNTECFTQGLALHQGSLYESCGLYHQSKLIRYTPGFTTSQPIAYLPSSVFAEGIASDQHTLYQLTWKNAVRYHYANQQVKTHIHTTQGWGLTYHAPSFYATDGSHLLYIYDPDFNLKQTLSVTDRNQPVAQLNDLTYVHGFILANIWYEDRLALINLENGSVMAYVDLSFLRTVTPGISSEDVINGLCTLPDNTILITGKNWPNLFRIKLYGL